MKPQKKDYYTFDEWLSWDEDVRSELHEGVLVMLAQPTIKHQRVLRKLMTRLDTYLQGKPCEVFPAPVGVRLSESEETAFEPDIIVVCDKSKLKENYCNGAPDLVIEILSPSTARYDRGFKYMKYQAAGVREYWIVDPELKLLQAGVLHNEGFFVNTIYETEDVAPVSVLEGCEISLSDIFADEE